MRRSWEDRVVCLFLTGILLAFAAIPAMAQEEKKEEKPVELPKITVPGIRYELEDHPGAATVITEEEIEVYHPLSTVDMLRRVPGIHAPAEFGRGLRPNIGIRGLNPFRSRNVLITADGVPIQPAVYGDPAAYYNVPVEQVERIEVIRGGASALYGPNTVGGVINYVTRRPPREREIRVSETVRAGELFTSTVSYGDTFGETGVQFIYINKTGSLVRDETDTEVNDVSLRFVFPVANGGEADLRLSGFVEESETPGGLTVAQFQADPNQSQRSNDVFFGRRLAAYLNYRQPISEDLRFEGQTYMTSFERDWFIADDPDATATTNTQFLRDFVVAGVEPKLRWSPNDRVDFVGGVRLHFEEEEDIRRQGSTPDARAGTTDREAELTTLAWALFASTDLEIVDGLIITPGIRYERVDQEREVGLRGGVGGSKGSLVTDEVVGGVGVLYRLTEGVDLFGNYSRNFQPPTFNEAIDPTTGTANDLAAEKSNNFEVGFRARVTDWLSLEGTGFWTDFENQIISEAGVLRNAEETRHRGLEGALNLGPWQGLSANVNATFLDTEFRTGVNQGNDLPEAPEVLLSWAAWYERPTGFGLARIGLDGTFVDERFTDAANTVPESADGTKGALPSYHVTNLRLELHPGERYAGNWKVFFGVNNLFDREFRVRRQGFFDGIIPGPTRSFFGGVSAEF